MHNWLTHQPHTAPDWTVHKCLQYNVECQQLSCTTYKGKCLPCDGFTTGVIGFFVGGKVGLLVNSVEGGLVTGCLSSVKIIIYIHNLAMC